MRSHPSTGGQPEVFRLYVGKGMIMDKYTDLTRGQTAAICNKLGGMPGIKRFLADELIVIEKPRATPSEPRTLKVLSPIETPASAETFSSDETFFAEEFGVKISYLGDNFQSWFAGVTYDNWPNTTLSGFDLTQSAQDSEIIEDLGGDANVEVTLCEIWRLMQRQASGQPGILLTNGYWNVFYVRGKDGVLRAVNVNWRDNGWRVYASALGSRWWHVDNRVFSRNS